MSDENNAGADGFDASTLPSVLPAMLDDVSSLPDYAQGLYEKGGDGRFAFKGLGPLRSANERIKRERDGFKGELDSLTPFKDIGKTPDEIREALTALEGAGKTPDAEEIERMKESIKTGADKRVQAVEVERDEWKGKAEQSHAAMQDYMVRTDIAMACAPDKLNGDPELVHLAASPFIRILDGKPAVFDTNGDQRFNGKGEPMTPYELLAEMRDSDRYGRLFNASGNGGGGASNNSGSGGAKTIKRSAFSALPPAEQSAKMRDGFKLTD